MLSNIQKMIILRAVKIRMERGEELPVILDSYPKLTKTERTDISSEVAGRG